ncbi:hypothetical protein N7474_004438 [Penicillium riverlandense]|uniref:uncharacterized protein n=1 Tax=Penicillium riverlandense TaxID=1903569 RepID=UPI0025480757|nr:uncharacterized protein N7474_004438 [Penicillium riverlandense]KAJ5818847.1 hypothetical protein N7474_004438 [Penicillium riverlandense]
MSAKAYKSTIGWICRLILRVLALLGCIAAIIFSVLGGLSDTQMIALVFFVIISVWNLVDCILLCVRCIPKLSVNIVIDLAAALTLISWGCIFFWQGCAFTVEYEILMISELVLGAICAFTAVLHIFLFALSTKAHRENRREKKHKIWMDPNSFAGPIEYGTTETLIPSEYRAINRRPLDEV